MGKVHEHVTSVFPSRSQTMGEDGRRRMHHVIQCSSCPAEATSPVAVSAGGLGLPELIRRFSRQNWYVGRVPGAHLCPDCNTTRSRAVLTIVPTPELELEEEPPVATEIPFADRRIINAKLEEVYENETVGYRAGWTDQKVGTDLGTVIAWVTELRAQNFGPASGNPLVAELAKEQAALRKDLAAIIERLAALDAKLPKLAA